MSKVLLFIALIWLVLVLFRQRKPPIAPKPETPEDMVSCVICGVHIPKSEAISNRNQHFCCEAHFMQRNK